MDRVRRLVVDRSGRRYRREPGSAAWKGDDCAAERRGNELQARTRRRDSATLLYYVSFIGVRLDSARSDDCSMDRTGQEDEKRVRVPDPGRSGLDARYLSSY